jgi:hypothetical protein
MNANAMCNYDVCFMLDLRATAGVRNPFAARNGDMSVTGGRSSFAAGNGDMAVTGGRSTFTATVTPLGMMLMVNSKDEMEYEKQ